MNQLYTHYENKNTLKLNRQDSETFSIVDIKENYCGGKHSELDAKLQVVTE